MSEGINVGENIYVKYLNKNETYEYFLYGIFEEIQPISVEFKEDIREIKIQRKKVMRFLNTEGFGLKIDAEIVQNKNQTICIESQSENQFINSFEVIEDLSKLGIYSIAEFFKEVKA